MTMPTTAPSKPHPLVAPIDVSKVTKEKDVKTLIKRLLDFHGWFHWMPAANGFGQQGVSDHLAIKDGVFLVVEAKFGTNKPRPTQKQFALQIMANDAFAFCVSERNIDHFAMWLESFAIAVAHQQKGLEVPDEHGARMLNAIAVLTDGFKD
jgi:hypothetical protein